MAALTAGDAIGDDVGHLLGEAAKILAQHLQIFLQVPGSRAGGAAHIAHAFARFAGRVT